MNWRNLITLAVLVAVAGCGVKSDLAPPDGKPAPKSQQDPSKPPSPIGR